MNGAFDWDHFHDFPVVGILRGFDADSIRSLVQAAIDGGLHNIEVTMNTPGACSLLGLVRDLASERMNVGAGTVCGPQDLQMARSAGAEFIVCPVVSPPVIRSCSENGIPVFPGALTPSEVYRAWEMGGDIVKLFPADALGPGYVRSLRGPLPQVRLMPTGGVTVANLGEYRRAGAAAYGVGGPLFARDRVAAGDWDWVAAQVRRFRAALSRADPQ